MMPLWVGVSRSSLQDLVNNGGREPDTTETSKIYLAFSGVGGFGCCRRPENVVGNAGRSFARVAEWAREGWAVAG